MRAHGPVAPRGLARGPWPMAISGNGTAAMALGNWSTQCRGFTATSRVTMAGGDATQSAARDSTRGEAMALPDGTGLGQVANGAPTHPAGGPWWVTPGGLQQQGCLACPPLRRCGWPGGCWSAIDHVRPAAWSSCPHGTAHRAPLPPQIQPGAAYRQAQGGRSSPGVTARVIFIVQGLGLAAA